MMPFSDVDEKAWSRHIKFEGAFSVLNPILIPTCEYSLFYLCEEIDFVRIATLGEVPYVFFNQILVEY